MWALDVSGGGDAVTLSEKLGYYFATNGEGNPRRINATARRPGTLDQDIVEGLADFGGKAHGYVWSTDLVQGNTALDTYLVMIERGIPPILLFEFWNPIKPTSVEVRTEMGPK